MIGSAEFYFSVPASIRARFTHQVVIVRRLPDFFLKAAHLKDVRLTVAEWPGGEPRTVELRTSPQMVKKVLRGATRVRLPKLSQQDRLKFTALPWCSRLKLSSDESSVAVVSGPAKIGREWFLPILGCYGRRIVVARPPGSAKGRSAAHRGQQHPLQTTFFAVSVTMSIRATDKFVVGVACERAVGFSAQVGLVKAGHASPSRRRLPHLT